MLRIGVLSDTHFTSLEEGLPLLQRLQEGPFRETEIILHAGDMVDPEILGLFFEKSVHAVRGNMDPPVPGMPVRKIVPIGRFRIGLMHGWGAPEGLEQRLLKEFHGERLDCLVFGHSHHPLCREENGLLLFNPGSPTDRRWAPFHSVGVLEVGEKITGQIIRID